jgi:hypothetical protein
MMQKLIIIQNPARTADKEGSVFLTFYVKLLYYSKYYT